MRQLKQNIKKRLYLMLARYFMAWSKISLRRWNPRVIAITGSVGKTTMLNLLEIQLGDKAHYSHHANSAFGIAFDVVGLRGVTKSRFEWLKLLFAVPWRSVFYTRKPEYYVVEIDSERPNEAELIAKWLKPEACLWISVGNSHAVYYDQLVKKAAFKTVEEAIAHEFSLIPQNTSKLVLIDAGNSLMQKYTSNLEAKVVSCHNQPEEYQVSLQCTTFRINNQEFKLHFPSPKEISLQLRMMSELMSYLQLPVIRDLSAFSMPPGRSNYFVGKNGLQLIDSSYNAHLLSMQSILEMFQYIAYSPKWVVIGDMIEQGASEAQEHQKLAAILQEQELETIVLVGKRTNKYILPILAEKRQAKNLESFIDARDALRYIEDHATNKQAILLKGSQYLEWIVEKLLANPQDISKLPRQELAAKKRRESRGLK